MSNAETNIHASDNLPPSSEDIDDDDFQAFVARVEAAFKGLESKKDKLISLYETGDQQALDAEIDAIVDTIASDIPEVQTNLLKIGELRAYRNPGQSIKDELTDLKARQNELYSYFRGLVINETGLPDEAHFSEIETSRNAITETLTKTFNGAPYTSDEALIALDIITFDKDDKPHYSFPETLVPASTTELWHNYLASVCNHVKAVDELREGKTDKATTEQADRSRTFAHNSVTKELHTILNLQPTNPYEFLNTRQLIANIRDEVLPTKEAALSADSLALLEKQRASLRASNLLSNH